MGLSSAVQWWQEWQLRILVLSSLFIQFFLFFSPWLRRVPSLRRLRVLVWLAYIGGDAVAIYALATLFNRNKQRATDGDSSALEVIWAPVLLIHLGGHVTITAYSLEDNELWTRHAITLVSQVTVALYVFCKWWSGEVRLLLAAVLLFVFGIIKFGLKPRALRRASFNHLLASRREERRNCALSLDEYVRRARDCVLGNEEVGDRQVPEINPNDYFVDLSGPYNGRLSDLQFFLKPPEGKKAYDMLQACFNYTFHTLYTRAGMGLNPIETFSLLLLLPFLAFASVVLFATSHKHGYDKSDVKVTYILFSCTAMLEFLLPLGGIVYACIPCLKFIGDSVSGWHDMVSQHNLLSFYVRKKKSTILMKLAIFKCLKKYVNKHCYVGQESAAREITELVQKHIEDGWKGYICDAATYRRFNDFRGQRTLRRHDQHQPEKLGLSLEVPFDKSVLLWHIATDLCFHQQPEESSQEDITLRGRQMSNYMIYLLFIRAEMLLRCTRPGLFAIAIHDLELILKNSKDHPKEEKQENSEGTINEEETLAREILATVWPTDNLIHEACELAKSLMKLHDVERWQVIQGVWVEMLCYSASRCRGYLHAKSLGEGGEYLSYVWLLWSYLGMETLPDKIHKPLPPEDKKGVVAADESAPLSQVGVDHQTPGFSSPV